MHRRAIHGRAADVLALSLVLASTGLSAACSSSVTKKHFEPKRFETQEDAGSGHVAVLSVIPWDEETKAYLQPQFTLTPQEALKEVVPTGM